MIGEWPGIDYLGVCDVSPGGGDDSGRKAADGIRLYLVKFGVHEAFQISSGTYFGNRLVRIVV